MSRKYKNRKFIITVEIWLEWHRTLTKAIYEIYQVKKNFLFHLCLHEHSKKDT